MNTTAPAFRLRRLAAAIGLLPAAFALHAQTPAVEAPAPTPAVGDTWKYRTIDALTGNEQSSLAVEFVEATAADRLRFRTTGSGFSGTRMLASTRHLEPCRRAPDRDAVVCAGPLQFPMKVGDQHAFDQRPWSNGHGYDAETCEVKAYEPVTVAAGRYDAFRIECSGTWTQVATGPYSGRVRETAWYAPAVNRWVRWDYSDTESSTHSNGRPRTRTRTELAEFTPKR